MLFRSNHQLSEVTSYHVCGVLLMTRPELAPQVELGLQDLEGVELHASQAGRLVITVEGPSSAQCAAMINHLATLPGVAASSLVYHQIDNDTGAASKTGSGQTNDNASPSQESAP